MPGRALAFGIRVSSRSASIFPHRMQICALQIVCKVLLGCTYMDGVPSFLNMSLRANESALKMTADVRLQIAICLNQQRRVGIFNGVPYQ